MHLVVCSTLYEVGSKAFGTQCQLSDVNEHTGMQLSVVSVKLPTSSGLGVIFCHVTFYTVTKLHVLSVYLSTFCQYWRTLCNI